MKVNVQVKPPLLVGTIEISYILKNITGLLIRAPMAKMAIGGADVMPMITKRTYALNGVSRVLEVPYIPGSSLKGRCRSLLELFLGLTVHSEDGKIYYHHRNLERSLKDFCLEPYCPVDDIFGSPSFHIQTVYETAENESDEELKDKLTRLVERIAPTRVIFTDAFPTAEYVKRLQEEKLERTGIELIDKEDFLEEKPENRIDRLTSAADPREFLRVRPEVEFEGKIVYLAFIRASLDELKEKGTKVRDFISDEVKGLEYVVRGLKLIEDTYLGGCGTRGYGKVRFDKVKMLVKSRLYYLGKCKPKGVIEETGDTDKTAIDKLMENMDNIISSIVDVLCNGLGI